MIGLCQFGESLNRLIGTIQDAVEEVFSRITSKPPVALVTATAPWVSVEFAVLSLSRQIHSESMKWWADEQGEPLNRNVYELLCLIHSEISEAMEGHRKHLMDDKLPHRSMLEVELADALIRIVDMAAGFNLDLAGAVEEKMAYNATREDHKKEAAELAAQAKEPKC